MAATNTQSALPALWRIFGESNISIDEQKNYHITVGTTQLSDLPSNYVQKKPLHNAIVTLSGGDSAPALAIHQIENNVENALKEFFTHIAIQPPNITVSYERSGEQLIFYADIAAAALDTAETLEALNKVKSADFMPWATEYQTNPDDKNPGNLVKLSLTDGRTIPDFSDLARQHMAFLFNEPQRQWSKKI